MCPHRYLTILLTAVFCVACDGPARPKICDWEYIEYETRVRTTPVTLDDGTIILVHTFEQVPVDSALVCR